MKKKGGLLWIPGTKGVSLKDAVNSDAAKELFDDSDDEYDETSVKPQTQGSPKQRELLNQLKGLAKELDGQQAGRRKTKKLRRKFDKCVKAVRKTVKARKGSTKKQAAYAICTASILKGRVRT